ncbi:hypothetical protein BH10PSE12_BH10PSE12_24690 [soil metagenome]
MGQAMRGLNMREAAPAGPKDMISDTLPALIAVDGTQGHSYPAAAYPSLLTGSLSNMADAAHYLCMLHGRQPSVIDHAATRTAENAARSWLVQAADGFALERGFLTHISVALGPVPSTSGQSDSETAVIQQRHALDMLAQSDRRGCAMGAAIALVLDWRAIRKLLDMAALRVGIEPKPSLLPDYHATLAIADALAGEDEGISRAMEFGVRQMLRQHGGLWDLLQARASVRAQG